MSRFKVQIFLVALAMCLAVAATADTQWVKIDGTITSQTPRVVIEKNTTAEYSFRVHIPTFKVRQIELEDMEFQTVDFARAGRHSNPGDPAVPVFSQLIAIPEGATPEVQVTVGKARTVEDVNCAPAQAPAADCYGVDEPEFALNDDIYNSNSYFPGRFYDIEGPFVIRGLQMMMLRVYPVQVNPVQARARLYPDLRVEVEFHGTKGKFFGDRRGRAFKSLYNLAANRMAFINEPAPALTGKSPTGAEFVILTAPDFADAAADLAEWKVLQGYDTEVYTTDETGTSVAAIKAWVQNAYDTWDPAPEFILFLGDAEFISPTYDNPSIGSDLYYVTVDGDDEWADIAHARISVDTLAEAQKHIDDIVNYERYPITDVDFYTNSYHAAYFQHSHSGYAERRFCRTSEETYQWFNQYMAGSPFTPHRIYFTDSYVTPLYWNQDSYQWTPQWWTYGDLNIPPDLLRSSGFAWDGGDEDITTAVNSGTAFITHRDHGGTDGWSEPAFSAAQALALVNGDKLPVVWSINCLTGYFDEETAKGGSDDTNRFSEAWERNPNGGAVGILASTRVSYSGRNDRMFWGWLDSMWPEFEPEWPEGTANEPEWRMSMVLKYGKLYMDFHYSSDPYRLTAIEEFHWFGDPTMEMWAGVPQTMTVSSLPVIPLGATSYDVEVSVDDALVSLVQDGIILGKAYSVGGTAHVEFDAPIGGLSDVHMTVTRRMYRPHEEDIMVGATADGIVGLNRTAYDENGTVNVTLSDADLTDLGTYSLTITSTTEAGGESISLSEIIMDKAGTGTFIGEIDLTMGGTVGDGLLKVADGDDVIITYYDEDTGSGGAEEKTDDAYADCAAPTFAGVTSIDADDGIVNLGWSAATDLTTPIMYRIYRAETSGGQNFSVPIGETAETEFVDTGLENFVTYYYVVRAIDPFSHEDDNVVELSDMTVGPICIWEEDFDDKSGIPDDWEIIDNTGQCTWSDENPGGRNDENWDGVFIIADAEDCGNYTSWDDEIITESIDLYGYTDTSLAFTHHFENGGGLFPNHAYVAISNDGGTTWETVVNWSDDREGMEILDIAQYADNQADVKIKFRYTTGNMGEYWGLDNLEIIAVPNTDPPTADFAADHTTGNLPLTVHFTPQTSGAVDSYLWTFGDGATSTDQFAEHMYEEAGLFDVTLAVTGPYGDDTVTKSGFVDATCGRPTLDFDADVMSGPAPLTVQFSDLTELYTGCEPDSIEWNFGDGSTSADANPSHVYEVPGTYTVKLVYLVPYGTGRVTESRIAMIQVTCGPPAVDFEVDVTEGDMPLTVQFTDLSTVVEGCGITSRTWYIGQDLEDDPVILHGQTPTYVFATPGVYSVALEAENDAGIGEEVKVDLITVNDPAAGDDDTTDDDAIDDDDDNDDDDASPGDGGDDDAADDDDDDDDSGCGC
ncbi:MAG: C25 family cysteine peptidase [Candidatus Lernaella stagnicola]|nr:C25 family cysteine peptidase [Candidatus Lernaella stagnicola]